MTNSSGIQSAIAHYIRTGEADPLYGAWPGDWLEKAERGRRELREPLLTAVHRSVGEMVVAHQPALDTVAMTRTKAGPMVRGLFPLDEHEVVLNALERSVVFVTSANIEHLVFNCSFDGSAWTLANLYLAGAGADTVRSLCRMVCAMSLCKWGRVHQPRWKTMLKSPHPWHKLLAAGASKFGWISQN